jgi:hypothetical protein
MLCLAIGLRQQAVFYKQKELVAGLNECRFHVAAWLPNSHLPGAAFCAENAPDASRLMKLTGLSERPQPAIPRFLCNEHPGIAQGKWLVIIWQ